MTNSSVIDCLPSEDIFDSFTEYPQLNNVNDKDFIQQFDGNNSLNASSITHNSSFGCQKISDPAIFQVGLNGKTEISSAPDSELPYLPLIMVQNSRSLYNKKRAFSDFLKEFSPEAILIQESWEREKYPLCELLRDTGYVIISKSRAKVRNKQPGGGVAILLNPSRFFIIDPKISVPQGVEVVWSIITPKSLPKWAKIKRICLASIYISPRSNYKSQTITHIIESIHSIRTYYDNDIALCLGGDFNKFPIEDILDSLGSLQSVQWECTRKNEVLDLVITDMHTHYLPTTTIPPLGVDSDKKGVPSDHRIIIFPPALNKNNIIRREKKTVKTRPIPMHLIPECGKVFAAHSWEELFNIEDFPQLSYIKSQLFLSIEGSKVFSV